MSAITELGGGRTAVRGDLPGGGDGQAGQPALPAAGLDPRRPRPSLRRRRTAAWPRWPPTGPSPSPSGKPSLPLAISPVA